MTHTIYKKFGKQEYAYQATSYRDPQTKKPKHKQKYLGIVIDKEKNIYKKTRKHKNTEKQTLDYGDTYLLHQIIKNLPIHQILQPTFQNNYNTLMTLILHRLTIGTAMHHVENYYNGNYIKKLYPNAKTTSQDISRFLTTLGDENLQKTFLTAYIPLVCKDKTGIIIDSTGLPNQIHMPLTDWGYHNGGVAYETRLILAVDKDSKLPLYFRYVAGNIGDVSTLVNTVVEMKKHGVSASRVLVDAGYFSEDNLSALFKAGIDFLIRVPFNRVVCSDLVAKCVDIESPCFAVRYDKRGLFVKREEVVFCGRRVFLYLVLDPERRGREISKLVSERDEADLGAVVLDFSGCGKMVLMSSECVSVGEVVPLYYMRQVAERLFGVAKEDLGILPLGVHCERNFSGFMMLVFLSLVVYCGVKECLGSGVSLEFVVSLFRNLKCRVFDDDVIVPCEVTKQQRLMLESLNIVVPKTSGI